MSGAYLLSGASARDRSRLRRVLSALPLADPTDDTWIRIDNWIERAGAASERFGLGDLLIGAIAAEAAALVWSLDRDFARMSRTGLVALYEPRTESARGLRWPRRLLAST